MLKKYFIYGQSGQLGPFSQEVVMRGIDQGTHKLTDYIFEEGSSDWVLLMEHPMFACKFFKQTHPESQEEANLSVDSVKRKEWFVLIEECQLVPFSKVEIVRMLQQKILFDHDYIFNEKFECWKAVAEVEEFSAENIRKIMDAGELRTADVFFRRRFPRVRSGASLILHDKLSAFKGTAVEVSAGGAGILVNYEGLNAGQSVFLHFKSAGGLPPFNAVCEVVHKQVIEEKEGQIPQVKYGVKFITVSETIRENIKEYSMKAA